MTAFPVSRKLYALAVAQRVDPALLEQLEPVDPPPPPRSACKVDGCTTERRPFGHKCAAHDECAVDGCEGTSTPTGMCTAHTQRRDKYGDPLEVRKVSRATVRPYRDPTTGDTVHEARCTDCGLTKWGGYRECCPNPFHPQQTP